MAAIPRKPSKAQQPATKVYPRRIVADRVIDAAAQARLRLQLQRLQSPQSSQVARPKS